MKNELVKKLKIWREEQSRRQGLPLFKIMHNATIEELAEKKPGNFEELLEIKGMGEKKAAKFGKQILNILKGEEAGIMKTAVPEKFEAEEENNVDKKLVYSVSQYLDLINSQLLKQRATIKGEISSLKFQNGYLFLTLKDPIDESVIDCFMWKSDYDMCSVKLEEGIEVAAVGYPEVYKKNGRMTFRTEAVQLVGEGALKKAYEELKKKLEEEGIFDASRKKAMPDFPTKIGLVTSRDGAVINDFLNNIGRFGFEIIFYDSRVEGALAVKELLGAIKYFKNKKIDVLVMIRGGGSLESLQAFNNEKLVREVAELNFPVMCGIGHDKDVPLVSMAADMAFSTPSIVAREINKSWERALEKLDYLEAGLLAFYESFLKDCKYKLEKASSDIKYFYQNIIERFKNAQNILSGSFALMGARLKDIKQVLDRSFSAVAGGFELKISQAKQVINNYEKEFNSNNPERQLKLGYSILSSNGKIVRSVKEVKKGDCIENKLSDGEISSIVK